jgi:hypothetical protein
VNLLAIIERLRPLVGQAGIRTVSDALGLAALESEQVALPALFVIPASETAGRTQEGSGVVVVEWIEEFDVVTVLAAAAARDRSRDELHAIASLVTGQLIGWTPDPAARPIIPVASRLLGLGGGRVSWVQRFRTATHLRSSS